MKKSYLARKLKRIKTGRCELFFSDQYGGGTTYLMDTDDIELKGKTVLLVDEEIQYNRIRSLVGLPKDFLVKS